MKKKLRLTRLLFCASFVCEQKTPKNALKCNLISSEEEG